MPFEIVRNDITNMCVDAIVNTANPELILGYGCDASIHKKRVLSYRNLLYYNWTMQKAPS